jgi:hypothetical protein
MNKFEDLFVDEYNGKFSINIGSEYQGKLYPMKIKRNFGKEEKEARFSIRFDSKADLLEALKEMYGAVSGIDEVPF